MESQQDEPHLQAPAKTAPLASQKITYKQITVCTQSTLNTCCQCGEKPSKHCSDRGSAAVQPKCPLGVLQSSCSCRAWLPLRAHRGCHYRPWRCKFSTSCDFFFLITEFWDVYFFQEIILQFCCDFSQSK